MQAGPGRLLSSSECRTQRILDYFPERTPAFVSNFLRLLQKRILDRDCRPHGIKAYLKRIMMQADYFRALTFQRVTRRQPDTFERMK